VHPVNVGVVMHVNSWLKVNEVS